MNIVNIHGALPQWILFWELYNNSKQQGMGLLQTAGASPMTLGEAYLEFNIMSNRGKREVFLDYHKGRVMKVDLNAPRVRADLYDRDNGEGKFESILNDIQAKLEKYNWGMYSPETQSWFGIQQLEAHHGSLESLLDNVESRIADAPGSGFPRGCEAHLNIHDMLATSICVLYPLTNLDDLVLHLDGISSGRLCPIYPGAEENYMSMFGHMVDEQSKETIEKIISYNPLTIRRLES
jgi:hypothetical protein